MNSEQRDRHRTHIKSLLKAKGLIQKDMCVILKISPAVLNQFVGGWNKLPTQHRANVCKMIGMSLDEMEKIEWKEPDDWSYEV